MKRYASKGAFLLSLAVIMLGKPQSEALHKACFPCHEAAKARDNVFTRYAPGP